MRGNRSIAFYSPYLPVTFVVICLFIATPLDKPEEPPAKLLDDLFRKTKAAPCIYWLPLTEEQVSRSFMHLTDILVCMLFAHFKSLPFLSR